MTMKADLRAWLIGDPALAGLIGSRAHWGVLPQGGVMPAIVLNTVGFTQGYTMAGANEDIETRVQIDAWGRTDMEVTAIRIRIDGLLNGFRGKFGDTRVSRSFLAGGFDDVERTSDATEMRFRASMDFLITHKGN